MIGRVTPPIDRRPLVQFCPDSRSTARITGLLRSSPIVPLPVDVMRAPVTPTS